MLSEVSEFEKARDILTKLKEKKNEANLRLLRKVRSRFDKQIVRDHDPDKRAAKYSLPLSEGEREQEREREREREQE